MARLLIVLDLPDATPALWDPHEVADELLAHAGDAETFRAGMPVFTDAAHRIDRPELANATYVSAEWQ